MAISEGFPDYFFVGPSQSGADAFAGATGGMTLTSANTSTNLVGGFVATALANGFAAGLGPASDGSPPSAAVYVDASVSGGGAMFYGSGVHYGGGIGGYSAYDSASQYAAVQGFGGYAPGNTFEIA